MALPEEHGLPLVERLALERTKLASRRTLLAYFRTSLAFLTAGGGMSEFLNGKLFRALSFGLLLAALLVFLWGVYHFFKADFK